MLPGELRYLAVSRSGPRWRPADPVLRQTADEIRRRLISAQAERVIPHGSVSQYRRARQLHYEVTVSRDTRSGQITANIRVQGFEGRAADPDDAHSVLKWIMTSGMVLVRVVDQAVDRGGFSPPLAGRTLLVPELGE
jgi:hypothetical protein